MGYCLLPMKSPVHSADKPSKDSVEQMVYTVETPKWRQYYQRVRKTIRFPRYYKKTLNW